MNIRITSYMIILLTLAAVVSLATCSAQDVPSREQWGEKFNSTGAKLTFKEIGRTTTQGRTVITYNLFASGLAKERHYILCILNVGSDPQAAADAYLNSDGKVVNVLADPAHHVAEDPINAKVFGGKGEPIQFALISDDDQLRAFAEVIPFPIEAIAGSWRISAIETGPYYSGVLIRVTGLQPDEELSIEQLSDNETGQSKGKADAAGAYNAAVFPFCERETLGQGSIRCNCKIV